MSKAMGSWSGMRKYLEKDMLAATLQGRIRYNCTRYVGMDGSHIFEIYIDDKKIKQFSWETVNSYFIKNGLKENNNPWGIQEYWADCWSLLDAIPMNERSEYTDDEFCDALEIYRNQQIEDSLYSENPLVRMFAILDRRVGKRTLINQKSMIEAQPTWLQHFYNIRIEAEEL
jgi:hypothetical protein